jgi:hypothetical protein
MDFTISNSYVFSEFIRSDQEAYSGRDRARSFGGRNSLTAEDAARIRSPPQSPPMPESPGDMRLYLPTAPPSGTGQLSVPGEGSDAELDRLISIRNLFAFLTGQPLVATRLRPSMFHVFLQISSLLEEFGFASVDGATFGNAVDLSFNFYVEQLQLADCRNSREKTLEALILGERMRSIDLYTEAFAHAAGKYSAIVDLRLPLFEKVSPRTRQQLEKAHLDLVQRQHNVNEHLEQFEFPSLFAGIANSTSMAELRHVRFNVWRKSFNRMRSFVLNHYKMAFGNWPPKASSNKNPFAESGLNRVVLKMLYADMCALYDLLVDRTNRTSRVIDEAPALSSDPDKMILSALRVMMSEYDRSRPPVLPPVPYDVPQLPSMTSIFEAYDKLPPKDQVKFEKKIKEHELILVLNKAYNYDANRIKSPLLAQFKDFELREAKGKMAGDLVDQRIGHWLFLYVVIQSLPMLVVDAPGLNFTEGTEYFLCEPPMGNPPWMEDRQVRKMWYEVAGGGGLVELSTDAVLFSVEAIYNRSHCWQAAKVWEGNPDLVPQTIIEDPALPALQPPPPVLPGTEPLVSSPPTLGGHGSPVPSLGSSPAMLRPSSTLSPDAKRASHAYRSSVSIGLEPIPLEPPGVYGNSQSRSSSHGPRSLGSERSLRNSRSAGNLAGMNLQQRGRSDSPKMDVENSGATFDDILGDSHKKPEKKKGFFF